MTKEDLQSFLARPYERAGWLQTLRGVLPQTETFSLPQPLASADDRAESVFQLGRVQLQGDRQLGILEVRVGEATDLARNRVGLRNLVTRFIDQAEYHGMLSVFLTPRPDYRFTFAARESAFDTEGKLLRTETAPRRYTYLLGPGESCRTPAERFAELAARGRSARIKDLVEAFNVEKLNQEFFTDYRKAFQRVTADILQRNPQIDAALAEREAQTLFNRLLFLCFVQRKGWLNRQRDYLFRNFHQHADKRPDGITFHQQFLKPLFIKLATEGSEADIPGHDLPFLNGGLFADEYGAEQRGEAARRSYSLKIGNGVFQHIFDDLLQAYNFTVREDSPLSVEVAIDPEMLGKVFESLVLELEQSDTGGQTSRHDTGSFYTPRPIVHYLCREGLRGWLEQFPPDPSNASDWPQRLEKLLALDASDGIDPGERAALDACLTPEEARAILDRLDDFRACDLAVGSGAFPVGLLHELVNLRRLCETRSRGKDPVEADSDWLYETKARIIERCLYGVDIQERAIEICKLRLWLSLMVDFELGVDVDNCSAKAFRDALKKITPLPNLDFKIRCANSLVDMVRGQPIHIARIAAEDKALPQILNKLSTAKHDFYKARKQERKNRLRFNILDATAELALLEFQRSKLDLKTSLLTTDDDADLARHQELEHAIREMRAFRAQLDAAKKLKNPAATTDALEKLSGYFDDKSKPTFVWQIDFAEVFHRPPKKTPGNDLLDSEETQTQGGFDLMLANPPYVRHEKIKEFKPLFQSRYTCYTGTTDLYAYFYEQGFRLLRPGGVLAFISSNSFMNAGFAKKLRQFLKAKTSLRILIDFAETKVFTAITEPCILVATKREPTAEAIAALKWDESQKPETVTTAVKQRAIPLHQDQLQDGGWQLECPAVLGLLTKLRSTATPLGKLVKGRFFYGLKTGLNDAFVVDKQRRDQLVAEHASSAEVLKPFIRGRDVHRWRVQHNARSLLFVPWHFPLHLDPDIQGVSTKAEHEFKKRYPAVYDHLHRFKKDLSARNQDETGIRYEWYALQRWGAEYWQEFETPKIVYQDIARYFGMGWDDSNSYLANTCYFIPRAEKWLLGALLSSTMLYYVQKVLGSDEGGFIRLFSIHVENFPVPTAPPAERTALAALVDRVLEAKRSAPNAPVSPLEREINERVYRLYGLTKDEIQMVEEATNSHSSTPAAANDTE